MRALSSNRNPSPHIRRWGDEEKEGERTLTLACWDLGRINSATSTKHRDGLEVIRIWVTLLRKLVFWMVLESLQMVS